MGLHIGFSARRVRAKMQMPELAGAPGRYWHTLEDRRIQCDLCPRFCRLHEGQRGLCFVRARQGDAMVLTTYGRSSGFCIDPIEKKPLNHFLPGTPVLSFGTAGCNLTCKFCQNWDISKARAFDRLQDYASPEAIAQAAVASGCRSVAFTYNAKDRTGVPGRK
jgi:pyruvate formate lyase activating enzyme